VLKVKIKDTREVTLNDQEKNQLHYPNTGDDSGIKFSYFKGREFADEVISKLDHTINELKQALSVYEEMRDRLRVREDIGY